jgi:hypothetical protein
MSLRYLTMLFVVAALTASAQESAVRVRHGYILPASKDLIIIGDPNWDRWKPTEEDVEIVEALLRQELKAKRKQLGIKKPCRYKRQYVGYINEAGERIIWVNAVCGSHHKDELDREPIIVFEGGPCYWNARVNIQQRTVFGLGANSKV